MSDESSRRFHENIAASFADVGRINPTLKDPELLDVSCPMIKFKRKQVTGNTMSLRRCVSRIKQNNKCTFRCPISIKIKEKYPALKKFEFHP
jgi:hypothetical protein